MAYCETNGHLMARFLLRRQVRRVPHGWRPRTLTTEERSRRMKTSRVLALGLMIAFLALPVAAADNWSGWITDSHCGAKGAKAGHTDCAVKCMKEGHKLVFLNDADK